MTQDLEPGEPKMRVNCLGGLQDGREVLARCALAMVAVSAAVMLAGCDDAPTQPTRVQISDVASSITAFPAPDLRGDSTGVASPQGARFTFPAIRQAAWQWNLEGTRANSFEYLWTVTWKNGDQPHQVGYLVLKPVGAPTRSGTLAELLQVGLCGVWSPVVEAAPLVHAARCVAEDDRVVLILDDGRAVQALVSARPSSATFTMKLAGQAAVSADVELSYQ